MIGIGSFRTKEALANIARVVENVTAFERGGPQQPGAGRAGAPGVAVDDSLITTRKAGPSYACRLGRVPYEAGGGCN